MEFKITQEQLQTVYNLINKGIYNVEAGVVRQVQNILENLPKIEDVKEEKIEKVKKMKNIVYDWKYRNGADIYDVFANLLGIFVSMIVFIELDL